MESVIFFICRNIYILFFSYKVLKIWCVFYLSAHVESDRPHSMWLVAAVLNGTGLKAEQRDTRGAGEHRRVTYSKAQDDSSGHCWRHNWPYDRLNNGVCPLEKRPNGRFLSKNLKLFKNLKKSA